MKRFLGLIVILLGLKANAQDLTLTGNALLSIKESGLSLSSPAIKLKDKSRLIHPGSAKLMESTFIQLLSPEARVQTGMLSSGETYELAVGIKSKTIVKMTAHQEGSAYAIGMQSIPTALSLPFSWSIDPLNAENLNETSLFFSWEEDIEPTPFVLKALVSKSGNGWQMLPVSVSGSIAGYQSYMDWSGSNEFTIKTINIDSDFDEVPDVQELADGTDWKNTGEYLDSDDDGVPDYIERLEKTNPNDPSDFLDSTQDGVPDYIRDRSLLTVLDNLERTVSWGDLSWNLGLADSILMMTGYGRLVKVPVQWNVDRIDVFSRGTYKVKADMLLPDGIFNPYGIQPELLVEVLPKASPTDVQLSNAAFTADIDSSYFEIGQFSVLDHFDNVHLIKLLDEGYDNLLFEISNNTLFWKSDERAEGKTTFTIIIRVTDRDGNVLDKFFEINRNRPQINDIQVNNTFTPNGDGINDNWGVPELRFYAGVRIQVFERSGRRVFYSENPDVRWDGTWKGNPVPVGTYFWTIEIEESKVIRKGLLNILRK